MSEENKQLRVIDQSANSECPVRVHDVIVNGQIEKISFEHGRETILPYHIGVKFMQDGFIVMDIESKIEMKCPAKTDETVRIRINEDEVVARYDELTDSALKLRAAARAGGEKFLIDKDVDRNQIITFLKHPQILEIEEEEISEPDEIIVPEDAKEKAPSPEFTDELIVDPESEIEFDLGEPEVIPEPKGKKK